ncbi:MAG: hypothetical protein GX905_07080 [Bacteroidales bacterium]|nr:hypothetical protein [Bacteroidales bacterium]
MADETIKQLQQELYSTLKKAHRNQKMADMARMLNYGAALIYFLVLFGIQVSFFSQGDSSFFHIDYTENPNPTFWEQNKLFLAVIPLL